LVLSRLLDFALLTFLVWLVWSQVLRGWRAANAAAREAPQRSPDRSGQPPGAAAAAGQATVTLVRCGACGVHVPSGRTLPGPGGEVFCSDACRARGAARQTG
jgi:hypothetical protein